MLKKMSITPKVLAMRTNVIWDILLATEQQAKQFAGSVWATESLRLQTEYMDTRRTKITVHGVSVDISTDRVRAFFSNYGPVEGVTSVKSKTSFYSSH